METTDRVTREINLIARNFECLGDKTASAATADHVRRFWAPLLRAALRSAFGAQPDQFSPIARQAVVALEQSRGASPAGQASVHSPMTRETRTEHGSPHPFG
jgi:hypothetical protein